MAGSTRRRHRSRSSGDEAPSGPPNVVGNEADEVVGDRRSHAGPAGELEPDADTIRSYERRGVLPPPERRASGYRVYSESTAERIRLAKSLQANGFTLDEIIDALASMDAGTTASLARAASGGDLGLR